MKDYPNFTPDDEKDAKVLLRYIVKERRNDIQEFNNLKNVFLSGRKVGKIPAGATDISDTDRVGDMSNDIDYIYVVVDNAGTAEWRRAILSTW